MEKYENINNLNAMQGLGYKQILSYLQGYLKKEEAVDMIKKKTRHFAKRQMSWFKNQIKIDCWINLDQYQNSEDITLKIVDIMKREGY